MRQRERENGDYSLVCLLVGSVSVYRERWTGSTWTGAGVARKSHTMASQEPLNQQCGFHVKESTAVDKAVNDEFGNGIRAAEHAHGAHQVHQVHQFPVQQSALSFGTAPMTGTAATQSTLTPSPSSLPLRRASGNMAIPASTGSSKLYRISGNTKARLAPSSMSPGLAMSQGDMTLAEHSHLTPGVKKMMRSVVRGLKAYQEPEAATEGLGGTYFFKSETGGKIAIMKPCDEEPMAPSNPKGFRGRQLGEPGLKPTVRVGEAASREVAAYLLDHKGMAGVPHTVMVRMAHPIFHYDDHFEEYEGTVGGTSGLDTINAADADEDEGLGARVNSDGELPLKLGSLQSFVRHECDSTEMGSKLFNKKDVHRIGILDVRLFNTDRHGGNILVQKVHQSGGGFKIGTTGFQHTTQYKLVPIDHGFALPEGLEPPYYEWQHWPQAMLPFDKEELDYIASLDAKADVELLRKELPDIQEGSFRVLELATLVLKKAAAAGLTLSEIAGVLTRPICIDEEPSELEKICFEIRKEMFEAELEAARRGSLSVNRAASHLSSMTIEDIDVGVGCERPDVATGSSVNGSPGSVSEVVTVCEGGCEDSKLDGDASPGDESTMSTYFSMNIDDAVADDDQPTPQLLTKSLARKQTDSDALFSMDEDGGNKTPPPGSPVVARSKEGIYIEAPTLRVKATGEVEHLSTPFGTTFKSVLGGTAGSSPSYDSESPTHQDDSGAIPEDDVISAFGSGFDAPFRGAQSYIPTLNKFPTVSMTVVKDRRQAGGISSLCADGSLTPSMAAAVEEPRGCYDSSFVLKDMDERAWAVFMAKAEEKIADKLARQAWIDTFGAVAQMSCPV